MADFSGTDCSLWKEQIKILSKQRGSGDAMGSNLCLSLLKDRLLHLFAASSFFFFFKRGCWELRLKTCKALKMCAYCVKDPINSE